MYRVSEHILEVSQHILRIRMRRKLKAVMNEGMQLGIGEVAVALVVDTIVLKKWETRQPEDVSL